MPRYFTSETARECQKKGVEAKKRNKTIRETTNEILKQKVTDKKQLAAIEKAGLPVSAHPTYRDFIVASILLRTAQKGRMDDLLKLMDVAGESIDNTDIEDSDAYFAAGDLDDDDLT